MPRELCNKCEFPIATCVCQWIAPYCNSIHLHILQHPKEANHAKNTVKLIGLATKNIEIIVGEGQDDFQQLINLVASKPDNFALLYPSEQALTIRSSLESNITNLIVIDGTWRKAKKMYLSNPWLKQIRHLALSESSVGEYAIRKTSVEGGLSTLEAVAMALNAIDDTPKAPLLNLFDGFQSKFMKQMPKEVQSRYHKKGD